MSNRSRVIKVLERHEGIPISVREVWKYVPDITPQQISNILCFLRSERGCVTRTDQGWIYSSKEEHIVKVLNSRSPIYPEEVANAKMIIGKGSKLLVKNYRLKGDDWDDGDKNVVVTVKATFPHVVLTTRNMSFTWNEITKWLRDKRVAIE